MMRKEEEIKNPHRLPSVKLRDYLAKLKGLKDKLESRIQVTRLRSRCEAIDKLSLKLGSIVSATTTTTTIRRSKKRGVRMNPRGQWEARNYEAAHPAVPPQEKPKHERS
eukprot:scaffold11393_cov49-Attheya_sp.AAC.2